MLICIFTQEKTNIVSVAIHEHNSLAFHLIPEPTFTYADSITE